MEQVKRMCLRCGKEKMFDVGSRSHVCESCEFKEDVLDDLDNQYLRSSEGI